LINQKYKDIEQRVSRDMERLLQRYQYEIEGREPLSFCKSPIFGQDQGSHLYHRSEQWPLIYEDRLRDLGLAKIRWREACGIAGLQVFLTDGSHSPWSLKLPATNEFTFDSAVKIQTLTVHASSRSLVSKIAFFDAAGNLLVKI
jgi:hypothetical protein